MNQQALEAAAKAGFRRFWKDANPRDDIRWNDNPAMHKHWLQLMREALTAYAEQTGEPAVNPVMFLVCSTIEEANEVAEILAGQSSDSGV